MRRVSLALAAILLSISGSGQAQTSMSFSTPQTSLSANAGGAGTVGTAFTAPPGNDAALVTWTTSYSAPPASVTMLLQASLDNSTWFTLDSSTAVAGELRNIATAARFFRCNISAVSGAVNKTCSFVLKRSNAATSSAGTTFVGNVTSGGRFLASDGTATAPSFSFTNYLGNGLSAMTSAAGIPVMSSNATAQMAWFNGHIQMPSTEVLGWSTGGINSATDTSIARGGATGIITLGNAITSTDFNRLNFGGTTSAFPAWQRTGATLQARLADNSANAGVIVLSLQMSTTAFAALGTPGNGTFLYCSDCTIASPCAGAGTGAFAKRLNGIWVCN